MRSALFAAARITPAYAGKRFLPVYQGPRLRDHPRLRGEKMYWPSCCCDSAGSPPLTRGKVSPSERRCLRDGITPAYAGKRLRHLATLPKGVFRGITPAYAGKRLYTVAKRSHIICSYPVFYCISFDILPPPFNCSYSLLVISQSFSARCGFIFCQPKYLASVVSW